VPGSLFYYSDQKPSRVPRIVLGVVSAVFAWNYYATINGLVRRSAYSAFIPSASDADDLCKVAPASWRPVSITASDGVVLRAWRIQPEHPNGKAVVLLHNLKGTRLRVLPLAVGLLRHGFICLLPDSRGHGASGGELVTLGLLEKFDVAEWVRFIKQDAAINAVYGLGLSLGASALIQSLSVPADFRAIVADSTGPDPAHPYQYLADRFHVPLLLIAPISWPFVESLTWNSRLRYGLHIERASPLEAIRSARIPVLLIQGMDDWLIPVRYARRLHEANPQYSELWEVPGGNHLRVADATPVYQKRVIDWFTEH
jgi:pimeloyl-ACP methyl ester carboxylesterase